MDLFSLVQSNNYLQLQESISTLNINIENINKETPTHIACKYGHVECLRILINAGADINSKDFWGWTCLIAACAYAHPECIKELLQRGADTSILDHSGETALHNMCVDSRHVEHKHKFVECIRTYMENCSDLDHPNHEGITALMLSQKLKYKDIVDIFEEYQLPIKGACDS